MPRVRSLLLDDEEAGFPDMADRADVPPSRMDRETFVQRFGPVFEHSPWIAEIVHERGLEADADTAGGLHSRMTDVLRAAEKERQLDLIRAHPDLAGRLEMAGELSAESSHEQQSAGLDHCTPEEYRQFQALNDAYKGRFGFPFVMAVKGRTRADILDAFEARIRHDRETEFETALTEIERIALLRLEELLPETGDG